MDVCFHPRPVILDQLPPGQHAVVEASAGTGKTFTIEHLVLDRLLTTEATIERILVVTFTEKATSELRARIRALMERALSSGLTEPPEGPAWTIDEALKTKLEHALFGFERAPIFTIHGFCNRMISEHAFEAGQLFEQTLVDGRRAFEAAFRDCLRTELGVKPELRELLLACLNSGLQESALTSLLFDAHRQRVLETPGGQRPEEVVTQLKAGFDRAAVATDLKGCALTGAGLEKALAVLKEVEEVVGQSSPAECLEALAALDLSPLLQPPRTRVTAHKKHFPTELTLATKRFFKALEHARLQHAMSRSLERQAIQRFLPVITARLTDEKRARGELDYDDLLERLKTALDGPRGARLAAELAARFDVAFIDEFQDTDDRQWAIFRQIFLDAGEALGGRALCLIGDPKQAIYSFRGADVHTYLAARDHLVKACGAPRVPLKVNYRSSAPLIEAVNLLLDPSGEAALFSGPIGYDDPVQCGDPHIGLTDASGQPVPPVVLCRYDPPKTGREKLAVGRLRMAFQEHLGLTVKGLLEADLSLTDSRGARALRPKDVFVLVRTNREGREASEALTAHGVPFAFFRQEGLFETAEASDVRAMLAALADPHDQNARLRAFATPFFGVALEDLVHYRGIGSDHPFFGRLALWRALVEQELLPALFESLLHQSGLLARLLFLREDQRALANYLQIFEVLTEEAGRLRLSLPELVTKLDLYRAKRERPEGQDADTQRVPEDRDAVQILTIHKAKGLEAPVVVLYGGLGENPERPLQAVHDERGVRHVLAGKAAQMIAHARIEEELRQEDQRLLYVALTRAKVRLYLPFVDSSRDFSGSIKPLNDRLRAAVEEGLPPELFRTVDVAPPPDWSQRRGRHGIPDGVREALRTFEPPPSLCVPPPPVPVDTLANHRPLMVTSYTRMKKSAGLRAELPLEADEFRLEAKDARVVAAEDALPGGANTGQFLHEVIEALPLPRLPGLSLEDFGADAEVRGAFLQIARRHGLDPVHLPTAMRLIHQALTLPLRADDTLTLPPLASLPGQVELELLFPLPEEGHRLLSRREADPRAPFKVQRGFVKGFVDLVFSHEGRIYFADWKSDQLERFEPEALTPYVAEHYQLQAEIYTLGLVRWLGIQSADEYEARFGGLLYVFLRGLSEATPTTGEGIYFDRPSFESVCAFEARLLNHL